MKLLVLFFICFCFFCFKTQMNPPHGLVGSNITTQYHLLKFPEITHVRHFVWWAFNLKFDWWTRHIQSHIQFKHTDMHIHGHTNTDTHIHTHIYMHCMPTSMNNPSPTHTQTHTNLHTHTLTQIYANINQEFGK